MCTKCINKGDPKISLTRPFDVGTFHPIVLELRIVKLKRKDFFTLAFDVGTFITILWNWEKIMFNGLTFQICFCNLSLQRFGFIAFLCLSCHATAYPHEVGLPAHVENCCLWEIVPFMLARAYQNVASQAQHVQFFFWCFTPTSGTLQKHSRTGPIPKYKKSQNKNTPGRGLKIYNVAHSRTGSISKYLIA